MRTALGKVRGLGSAKSGVHHWWAQRLTAIALLPLMVWFVASLVSLVGADHRTVVEWIANPLTSALLVALVIAVFYHLRLGLQVVIEDYLHGGTRMVLLVFVNFASILLGLMAIIAVLKIAFGS